MGHSTAVVTAYVLGDEAAGHVYHAEANNSVVEALRKLEVLESKLAAEGSMMVAVEASKLVAVEGVCDDEVAYAYGWVVEVSRVVAVEGASDAYGLAECGGDLVVERGHDGEMVEEDSLEKVRGGRDEAAENSWAGGRGGVVEGGGECDDEVGVGVVA